MKITGVHEIYVKGDDGYKGANGKDGKKGEEFGSNGADGQNGSDGAKGQNGRVNKIKKKLQDINIAFRVEDEKCYFENYEFLKNAYFEIGDPTFKLGTLYQIYKNKRNQMLGRKWRERRERWKWR